MTILKSKELTYYDILLNEKDISSIEDIVASVNKLIEGGESDSTSHLVLGSIDYGNNLELLEKYYSIENNEAEENNFSIKINNTGDLIEYPDEGNITLVYYYYYYSATHELKLKSSNKNLVFEVKEYQNEAIVMHNDSVDYDMTAMDADDGSEFYLGCIFDDGYFLEGNRINKDGFVNEILQYLKEKNS